MGKTLLHGVLSPGQVLNLFLAAPCDTGGILDHAFCGVRATIEENVLDVFEEFGGDVLVDLQLPGIHDPHGHSGLDGVIEEGRVDGLPDPVVPAEREGNIRDPTRDMGAGALFPNDRGGFDEILRVVVVFLHPGCDGENVRVEDDVLGRKANLFDEQLVCPATNFDLALDAVGLALFVKSHDDDASAIATDQLGLLDKIRFPLLEGN